MRGTCTACDCYNSESRVTCLRSSEGWDMSAEAWKRMVRVVDVEQLGPFDEQGIVAQAFRLLVAGTDIAKV